MKSVIEEFYYGNIEPMELNGGNSLKLKRKLSEIVKSEERFKEGLSDEEAEKFKKLVEEYNEFTSISCEDSFVTGFKLGARFAYEMFE